jgi:hypothetical protein
MFIHPLPVCKQHLKTLQMPAFDSGAVLLMTTWCAQWLGLPVNTSSDMEDVERCIEALEKKPVLFAFLLVY